MWKWECSPNLSPFGVRYSGGRGTVSLQWQGTFSGWFERVGLQIRRVASDMSRKCLLTDGGKHWGGRSELKGYVQAQWPGVRIRDGGRDFSFLRKIQTSQIGSPVPQAHTKLVPMALFPGTRRPERENDRLLQSNADVKDDCNHTFTPSIFLRESAGTTLPLFGAICWREINKRDRAMRFGRSHEKYI
jgi:hypothetical protein